MLNQTRKQINPFEDRLMELRKRWDNGLDFLLSELGERYLRRDFGVLLECVGRRVFRGAASLLSSSRGEGEISQPAFTAVIPLGSRQRGFF